MNMVTYCITYKRLGIVIVNFSPFVKIGQDNRRKFYETYLATEKADESCLKKLKIADT